MDFLQARCQQKCSRVTKDRGLDLNGVVGLGLERSQGKMECHPPARPRSMEVRAVPAQGAQK